MHVSYVHTWRKGLRYNLLTESTTVFSFWTESLFPFINSALQTVDHACLNSVINTAPRRLFNDHVKPFHLVTQHCKAFAPFQTLFVLLFSLQCPLSFNIVTFSCSCLLSFQVVPNSNTLIGGISASLFHIHFSFVHCLHPRQQLTFRFHIHRPSSIVLVLV